VKRVGAGWAQVSARVVRQRAVGAGHQWLDLAAPTSFDPPAPGQFVQLLLGPSASAALLPRPMSVASCRRTGRGLELGFLYAPIGTGTRALAALEAGATVEMLGPLGHGFPLERPGTPVLVAGGRGVAPLLFAADALARARRRCVLLFGARSRGQLVGLADARARLERLGGRIHLCTDDGSTGFRGHVVALLERVAPRLEPPLVVHACGPHAMLKAVARWSLARGVPSHLAMESIMACGTGVCRGCPLPRSPRARAAFRSAPVPSLYGNEEWAMCCTEGPVFEAATLDWERIE
jgi:dihydroorotate dehydrogenase electron transfer subunit